MLCLLDKFCLKNWRDFAKFDLKIGEIWARTVFRLLGQGPILANFCQKKNSANLGRKIYWD